MCEVSWATELKKILLQVLTQIVELKIMYYFDQICDKLALNELLKGRLKFMCWLVVLADLLPSIIEYWLSFGTWILVFPVQIEDLPSYLLKHPIQNQLQWVERPPSLIY